MIRFLGESKRRDNFTTVEKSAAKRSFRGVLSCVGFIFIGVVAFIMQS